LKVREEQENSLLLLQHQKENSRSLSLICVVELAPKQGEVEKRRQKLFIKSMRRLRQEQGE
jgi:hypothetical protein